MNKILLIKAELLSQTDRWVVNPLGLLYLASIARGMGFEVELLDLRLVSGRSWKSVLASRLQQRYDLIGISALSHQAPVFRAVSEEVKRLAPGTPQVAGGPLASSETGYCLARTKIDLAVIGEGEEAFVEILTRIKTKTDLPGIPGTAHLDSEGSLVISPRKGFIRNLDALPTPSWDLIDFSEYGRYISGSMRLGRRAAIQTSRGCPYRCVYCHSIFGKAFRGQSPEKVFRDMEVLYKKFGIRRFEIFDDIFNWDDGRAREILKGVAVRFPRLELSFPNAVRGDILNEETIRLMKRAGTRYLVVAIETASMRLQKKIRKNIDLERLTENVRLIKKHGIYTAAYFMVGFPGETLAEMEQTFALAESLPLDIAHISVVNAYKNTELWEMTSSEFRMNADVEAFDPRLGYKGLALSAPSSEYLLQRSLSVARRKIFLKPSNWFIIGNELLFRLRRGDSLAEKAASGLKSLKAGRRSQTL